MPQLTTLNRKWSTVSCAESPPGRIGHTFCANTAGTRAYVYGGVNESGESSSNYLDDYWEYDVVRKVWTQKELTGEVQCPRAFHTAVWYEGRMFIFGGCNGRGRFNKLFTINAEGECQSVEASQPGPPTTRYCHSAVVFEGCMYIFGGKCGGRNSNKRLSDLFLYNLEMNMWSECQQIGESPPSRSAHTALTHGRTMMAFGGRNAGGECCEDFYMYHFDTHVWRKITTHQFSLFGRARNSAVVHFGNVVVFGGWNGKKKLNDLFIYNVEANTFETAYDVDPKCPSRRECHVAVMCGNTMVVFGGRFRGNFMSDTAEFYLGPETAAESARNWLISAGMPDELQTILPLRLRESYLTHSILHKELNVSEDHAPATQVQL